jgi:hypothetical protein
MRAAWHRVLVPASPRRGEPWSRRKRPPDETPHASPRAKGLQKEDDFVASVT